MQQNRKKRKQNKILIILSVIMIMVVVKLFFPFFSYENANTILISSTEQDDSLTIVLDAGHGGYDSGSVSLEGVYEKNITLGLVLLIGDYLEEEGINVVYTRTSDDVEWESDNLIDLQSRVQIAEDVQADYFISIHLNSSEDRNDIRGYETYVDLNEASTVSMAENIHSQLSDLDYSMDRGLKDAYDSSLYVICKNSIPSLLLELGFMSNAQDMNFILSNPEELAQAVAKGIIMSIAQESI